METVFVKFCSVSTSFMFKVGKDLRVLFSSVLTSFHFFSVEITTKYNVIIGPKTISRLVVCTLYFPAECILFSSSMICRDL